MPHIFTNAEYADMPYVYGFCDGSATAAVEEQRRRFLMRRIPDLRVFSKVFNTLRECGTLMFHLKVYVNKTWRNRRTFLIWYSVALLLDFQHVTVFHEHVYGEHCMKTACTHFTYSLCKIYTQGTVPSVQNFVIRYILIASCFH